MASSGPSPRRVREYPLTSLSAEDFAGLCHRLVLIEHPAAECPAATGDGGADGLLSDGAAGWSRAWQHKRFTRSPHWVQCEKSLDDAVKNYGVSRVTFCFPRDLGHAALKTFNERLGKRHPGVTVDHWSASKLVALLEGREQGRRVARSFFNNVDSEVERISRAQGAQGILEDIDDVHERLSPIGDFLATRDAYFAYPSSTLDPGIPEQGTPTGTMLSVYEQHGESITRIDAVPRDEEAAARYGPAGRITFAADDEAVDLQRVAFALRNSVPFTAPEGSKLTFDRLPPFLKKYVGEPLEGRIDLIPARRRRPDLKVRLIARAGTATATLNVTLRQAERVPNEWDEAWEGAYGSFQVEMLVRSRAPGTLTLNYRWDWDRSASISAQAKILRFVESMERGAGLSMAERGSSKTEMVLSAPGEFADSDITPLLRFVENLLAIEQWSGHELSPISDEISNEDARTVTEAAALVRGRGFSARLKGARLDVDPEGLEQLTEGCQLAIVQDIRPLIFGREIDLGRLWFSTTDYQVEVLGRTEEGRTSVEISTPREASPTLEPPTGRRTRRKAAATPRRRGKGAGRRRSR
jgi:hypothetical protein